MSQGITIKGKTSSDRNVPVKVSETGEVYFARLQDLIDAVNNSGSVNYTTRIEEDSVNSNYTYIGNAAIGSSEGSAVWQIKRLDATTGLVKLFADGDDSFNNIWSNRESLSYS